MSSFTYQNEYNCGTGLFASGAANSGGVPIGTIIMWGTATPPSDYLLCDGTLYATGGAYAQLFAVILHTFGGSGGSFAVPNFNGKFPAGTGGSSNFLIDREMETGVIGSDGTGAANVGTGKSVLNVEATPDHHHSLSGTNSDTIAVNDDAQVSTSGLSHNHYYGHVHFNEHTHDEGTLAVTGGSHDHAVGTYAYTQTAHDHDVGTISYTQTAHDHEILLHDHDMPHTHDLPDHVHDLDAPGYTGNWAFPFGYQRISTANSGYWYGSGINAAANGAAGCYYPRSIAEQNNTTNPAGSAPSAATTGNSNTTNSAIKTATGSMAGTSDTRTATGSMGGTSATAGNVVQGTISGDTGNQQGTEYPEPLVTGNSRSTTAPHNSDVYTNNSGSGTTIPDHTHIQQQHTHTISGDAGAYKTTAGAAITQQKYAPPFLAVTFCIRYRQT